MKTRYLLLILLIAPAIFSFCTRRVVVVKSKTVKTFPRGQAKKITGSKSAKPYAPGQQKKRY